MKNPWKTVKKNQIYRNNFGYTIYDNDVITPAGKPGKFLVIDHSDCAVIITVTKDNKIVMVRQWRYARDCECLELPAGSIDNNENILDSAKRELREETGYTSDDWQHLKTFNAGLNTMNIKMHLYLARNAVLSNPTHSDETEVIETESYTYPQLQEMIDKNIIDNEYTLLSLILAQKYL